MRVPVAAGGSNQIVDTTVGRVLLYEIVPHEIPFAEVNRVMKKKELGSLIDIAYRHAGNKATVIFADKLKDLGYEQATRAGISIGIKDMVIPAAKGKLLDEANGEVREIEDQYNKGLITDGERYNKVVDIWAEVTDRIADEMLRELGTERGDRRAGQHPARPVVQPHLHDGRLRRARLGPADPAAGRHARADGEALRRDHRDAHHGELP